MRILLVLLSLVAIGWFAKPYLLEASPPARPSPEPATSPSQPRPENRPDLQALRNEVRTAPRLNFQPPEVNGDPRDVFKPAVTPEELAAIDARNKETLGEWKERSDARREEMIRQERRARKQRERTQDYRMGRLPR